MLQIELLSVGQVRQELAAVEEKYTRRFDLQRRYKPMFEEIGHSRDIDNLSYEKLRIGGGWGREYFLVSDMYCYLKSLD